MDTRGKNSDSDLGRHQRVLDAYLAHAGDDPLPPPSLDAKLLALAASSIKAASTGLSELDFARIDAGLVNARMSKTSARSHRRHWPFALAASVATIGFAAILARTGLLEAPGRPSYQTGSYEAKSVAQEQAAVDATAAMADATAADAQAAASETPGRLSDAVPLENREQVATAPPASDDKAKQNPVADAEFERSDAATLGRVAAMQSDAAAPAPGFGASSLDAPAAAPADIAATTSGAESAEKAFAPPAAVPAAAPAITAASEPMLDASPSPAATAAPELAELDVQGSDSHNRRAAPAAPPKPSADGAAVVLEEKPAPVAEITISASSKKDEFAPGAQADATNPHAKTFAAIRALRDSGEILQAKAMLARFVKAYPAVVLPADLKLLEKAGD